MNTDVLASLQQKLAGYSGAPLTSEALEWLYGAGGAPVQAYPGYVPKVVTCEACAMNPEHDWGVYLTGIGVGGFAAVILALALERSLGTVTGTQYGGLVVLGCCGALALYGLFLVRTAERMRRS